MSACYRWRLAERGAGRELESPRFIRYPPFVELLVRNARLDKSGRRLAPELK